MCSGLVILLFLLEKHNLEIEKVCQAVAVPQRQAIAVTDGMFACSISFTCW